MIVIWPDLHDLGWVRSLTTIWPLSPRLISLFRLPKMQGFKIITYFLTLSCNHWPLTCYSITLRTLSVNLYLPLFLLLCNTQPHVPTCRKSGKFEVTFCSQNLIISTLIWNLYYTRCTEHAIWFVQLQLQIQGERGVALCNNYTVVCVCDIIMYACVWCVHACACGVYVYMHVCGVWMHVHVDGIISILGSLIKLLPLSNSTIHHIFYKIMSVYIAAVSCYSYLLVWCTVNWLAETLYKCENVS